MTDEPEDKLGTLRTDPDEQMIVDRIYSAVMEQKLAPRTKLSELALCETFGVGRMRVRRALLLLSSQGIVDLRSNRGAYVACPSADEAREVFVARLMIETGIVRELARGISDEGVQALRAHVEKEEIARNDDDRTEMIRLSGAFHVELARCHKNSVLTRVLRELVTRTSLIVALFGSNRNATCPDDEHTSIIDAIADGQPQAAEDAIRHHILHVQNSLDLEQTQKTEPDLAKILSGRM
ncbi:GntR family transcriptional regulator [Ruegeria sp. AD91A]|uniref:GntR family transcriptional regulator n=1 Tax=Ruegeria sp. AD91A TaxID=2293862 RepID=UPI000E533E6C|nr:GntR family transcriptional regulator [Ruegeria sp. AD91A]AXT26463.1 GntR family transcriptional regulator [Ruegeria sp. AD91A]